MIDACPQGSTLRVTLWDVYATLHRSDGDVWDGVSAGLIEMGCDLGAQLLRSKLKAAANVQLPGAGSLADELLGKKFQEEVADLCGLPLNWLQMRFEGPDLYAYGAYSGDAMAMWKTPAVQDAWNARLNVAESGAAAAWSFTCRDFAASAEVYVMDEDLVDDDDVGGLRFGPANMSDDDICNGWVWFEGYEGIAGILLKLDVLGAGQVCP